MSRLRALRREAGWTQAQLAQRAGVGARTVVHIELGHSRPQMATRRALLRALRVPQERHRDVFGALPQEAP